MSSIRLVACVLLVIVTATMGQVNSQAQPPVQPVPPPTQPPVAPQPPGPVDPPPGPVGPQPLAVNARSPGPPSTVVPNPERGQCGQYKWTCNPDDDKNGVGKVNGGCCQVDKDCCWCYPGYPVGSYPLPVCLDRRVWENLGKHGPYPGPPS